MKFPGKRKSKHYFPVNARDPLLQQFQPENETSAAWVVGIDQTLVDIEAKVDDEFIERYGLSAGHSLVIEDDGGLTALIYPDFQQGAKDGMDQRAFLHYIKDQLPEWSKELPNYAKLKKIEVMSEDFERTPKKSIKRYLYQRN